MITCVGLIYCFIFLHITKLVVDTETDKTLFMHELKRLFRSDIGLKCYSLKIFFALSVTMLFFQKNIQDPMHSPPLESCFTFVGYARVLFERQFSFDQYLN